MNSAIHLLLSCPVFGLTFFVVYIYKETKNANGEQVLFKIEIVVGCVQRG